MKARKLLAVAGISSILAVTGAFGTLAYFSDTEVATNEFTVAGAEHETGVDIDLTETTWCENGEEQGGVSPAGMESGKVIEEWNDKVENKDLGDKYGEKLAEKLVPGRIIHKNPTVTVRANNAPCYVRMTVTMPTELYTISSLNAAQTEETALVKFNVASKWAKKDTTVVSEENGTTTVVYDYASKISEMDVNTKLPALFTQVEISTAAEKDDLGDDFNVVVDAYSVQAEGFGSADEAFEAAF